MPRNIPPDKLDNALRPNIGSIPNNHIRPRHLIRRILIRCDSNDGRIQDIRMAQQQSLELRRRDLERLV